MGTLRSANIKIFLLSIAVLIVLGTLFYTQRLVRQLLEKERNVANVYAKSLEFLANSRSDQVDYSFIFDQLVQQIDFPMILSDGKNEPVFPYRSSARNVPMDSTLSDEALRLYLMSVIHDLDKTNTPITVSAKNVGVLNYVHYGESPVIVKLRMLPYIEFSVAGLFILIGYIGFSYIKRSEQSNIWVGMAKETAHQLGTPLSSLMAWLDVMKVQADGDPRQLETVSDMENDLKRLQKVTDRFSKIGSKPNLKEENIHEVIESVIAYFRRRLPTAESGKGRRIELSVVLLNESTAPICVHINKELFEWVIENLIKNALDAMDGSGSITFYLATVGDSIMIDVKDTGKGVDPRLRKDIFRPGYSTKMRGWGLGLSLSKRIVEDYHKGKLFVKDSKIGKGTTFRIKLNR